ncbi:hypothetical protein ACFXKG_40325 [Streptomyces sp. NPDC059255]|uniref:hypothetical protein n=1 Tax=Streptomyces sp. NPDC059255 TaxID=3346793 RepID=UPI0036BFB222
MNAHKTTPPPDMGGVKDDWERARTARQRAENQQLNGTEPPPREATEPRPHDSTAPGDHGSTGPGSHGATEPQGHGATEPGSHEATEAEDPAPAPERKAPVRRRQPPGRRAAPRAADAVSLTVRVAPEEAPYIDALVLALRMETGIRLDKSEVIRALLRLTEMENGPVRRALVRHLKTTAR